MQIIKKSIILSALMMPTLAIAQKGQYKLNVNLTKVSPEAKIFLVTYPSSRTNTILDSASLTKGQAKFSFELEEPTKVTMLVRHKPSDRLTLGRGSDNRTFYLEKGTVSIKGVDSGATAKIKGGSVYKDYRDYIDSTEPKLNAYIAPVEAMMKNTPKDKQDAEYQKRVMETMKGVSEMQHSFKSSYIKANPGKYLSLDLVREAAADDFESTANADLFKLLSPEIQSTPTGQKIAKAVNAATKFAIGAIAPDFTQNDVNDKPVKLSDFRGKYVLLDFWASWCGPCREENPTVVKAYDNYKSKNFTVLGISLDRPGQKEAWLKAIEKDGLPWTQLSDLKFWDNEVAKLYNITAIPKNLLIGPDGKILAKNLRGKALEEYLKKIIG